MHRLNRVHGIEAVPAGRLKIEFLFQAVKELRGRLLPDAHGAIALHIAVTAHGTQTRARLTQLSAQQHQVDDLLNVGDGVLVLGQTHGPAKDYSFRPNEDTRRVFDFDFRDSGLFEDVAPVNRSQCRFEFFKPRSVTIDELLIENLARPALFRVKEFLHDPFQ